MRYDVQTGDWLLMLTAMTVMTILTAVAVVAVVRALRRSQQGGGSTPSGTTAAQELLDQRYARGEISAEEHRERSRHLAVHRQDPSPS